MPVTCGNVRLIIRGKISLEERGLAGGGRGTGIQRSLAAFRAIAQHYSELMDKTRRLLDFPITGSAHDLSPLFHSAISIVGGRRQISEATVRPDGVVVAFPRGST